MYRTYGNIHRTEKNQTSNIPTNYIEIYQTLIINWHRDKDLMKTFIAAPAWAGARCSASSLKLWRRRGINEQAIKTFISNICWSKTDNWCWGCTEVIKSAHEYMCSSTTATFHFNSGVPKPTNSTVLKDGIPYMSPSDTGIWRKSQHGKICKLGLRAPSSTCYRATLAT